MSSDIRLQPNVRRVEMRPGKHRDVVDFLKTTWFGRLYKEYFKKYALARLFVSVAWRNIYPVYVNVIAPFFLNKKSNRWRPLTKLVDFARRNGNVIEKLISLSVVDTPAPQVFPEQDQSILISPHENYCFPDIYVTTLSNGLLYGGTNLIQIADEVICHDLYDFSRDYTSEELHGRTFIDPKSSRIRWLLHDEFPEVISVAANFVDACAPNYAHWLTEVLPRIVLFCADERFKEIPIVINDGLHNNIMESLYMFAGPEREIIALPIGRALSVEKLYVTSASGYVPFERRKRRLSNHSHGVFSSCAFTVLCDKKELVDNIFKCANSPKKIYIRRNSGVRKVINSAELERDLVLQGFSVIEPEKLSFFQQVQLFSNARVIVGSSGAALANIIFAPKESEIYILIGKYKDTSYWYWQNIACASGKKINYILGGSVDSKLKGIHADFNVNSVEFSIAINKEHSRWRNIVKLKTYIGVVGQKSLKLIDSAVVETPVPVLFPQKDRKILISPHTAYAFPEIYVAEINKALVCGGTNLVVVEDQVICHDLYDFQRDCTSEELHGRVLIDCQLNRIRWLLHDEAPLQTPVAANFVDACAPNYAHWLTEVLPRIAVFCADKRFDGVPLIVNGGLHKNIMESLLLVAGLGRQILTVEIGKTIFVELLYVTSVAGYVPFDRRSSKLPNHSHGLFSPHAFGMLINKVDNVCKDAQVQTQEWSSKIYIRRNSGGRKVTNAEDLERALIRQGFTVVEPEHLTFIQQVQLFSHAKVIVASSGAALANIIFASKEAEIYILIGKYKDTSYWYWQNIACASGKVINYILGSVAVNDPNGIHADFFVDLSEVDLAMKNN